MPKTCNNPIRAEALRRAAEQWKRQLVDVSGRNRLLNYRDLKTGTLDLTPGEDADSGVNLQALESLLSGRSVRMTRLFEREETRDDSRRRLSAIYRRTQEHLDEKGLNTLFLAVGLATWQSQLRGQAQRPGDTDPRYRKSRWRRKMGL